MKPAIQNMRRPWQDGSAMTLMELLVGTAIGSVLVAILFTLAGFGQRSFAIVANDSQLESKSRYALDLLSRELKEATSVTSLVSNSDFRALTLTNASSRIGISLAWDADDRTLVLNQTGSSILTNKVLLSA